MVSLLEQMARLGWQAEMTEQPRSWTERTCAQQGRPVVVDDPQTLAALVVLFGGNAYSRAPHGNEAAAVECPTTDGRVHDEVVEKGA